MYTDKLYKYKKEDLLIFIISSIRVGDIHTAITAGETLKNDTKLYSEFLYNLGNHYKEIDNLNDAISCYNDIIIKCPNTKYVEMAMISISEINIQKKMYKKAIGIVSEVKSKKHFTKKISLIIISYFKTGKSKKAITLTKNNTGILLRSPHGEVVMKANLLYYYGRSSLGKFNRYARYLKRYKGNSQLVSYYTGKIYYRLKKFKKSYYYFYKLSLTDNNYREEVLYYLGKISLFVYRKTSQAIKYFNELILSGEVSEYNIYRRKAQIELAIIYNETERKGKSKIILDEIINGNGSSIYNSQATNLKESFRLKSAN
ncbi:tol-pal system YbgF family protein [Spirochaetota bacterium]